ncbi:hypothetical protein AAF712_005807 [Marasmius tenuissimus]|uniref:MHC class II antigen n=1 Tax=Marasmius tenuissimus TaxID=585030 RepID=A0ABR3A1M5_9AGAR
MPPTTLVVDSNNGVPSVRKDLTGGGIIIVCTILGVALLGASAPPRDEGSFHVEQPRTTRTCIFSDKNEFHVELESEHHLAHLKLEEVLCSPE